MADPEQIILGAVVTEKSTGLRQQSNTYTLRVALEVNKIQIRQAVEKLFNVKVKKVNTAHVSGKIRKVGLSYGKTSRWKKAYVELEKGQKIEALWD